jgi:SARP family transcriptional regulator, regulator of embCAB operon
MGEAVSIHVSEQDPTARRLPFGNPVNVRSVRARAALPAEAQVKFRILGPLEILKNGRECTPTAPKVLQVLALLVLRANRIVDTESLIQELWGEKPPRSAMTTIQTYVYHLRRSFEREGLVRSGDDLVATRPPGYILRVRPEQVDLQEFHRLSQQGRELLDRGEYAEAAAALRAGLALWSGRPLANVMLGPRLSAYMVDLQEQQMAALQLRIQAEMELGRHRDLIGELRSLVALYPLDEWLHGQLIRVLGRSGRRSDALQVYHNLRVALGEELGIDPSREIQNLHQGLLASS